MMQQAKNEHTGIRTQHHRINQLSLGGGLLIGCMVIGVLYSRPSAGFEGGLGGAAAFALATIGIRVTLLRFLRGTKLDPAGPFVEDVSGKSDEEILANEFVRLGGKSSAIAAARLPNDVGHKSIVVSESVDIVKHALRELLRVEGVLFTSSSFGDSQIKGLLGSGVKAMNPALVSVELIDTSCGASAIINAIAKEGAIKQHGGEQTAQRLETYLSSRFSVHSIEVDNSRGSDA